MVNFAFIIVNGLNALLLGIGAYDGGAAAAVTGFITVVQAGTNELFVRQEVVPLRPLEDLAERGAKQLGVEPPPV